MLADVRPLLRAACCMILRDQHLHTPCKLSNVVLSALHTLEVYKGSHTGKKIIALAMPSDPPVPVR
jgi:hypothetical protein